MRYLVVNADDFGFTEDVNEGIVECHVKGILTAATLMANGPAYRHAVELARAHPSLDIGCHLVLVGGRSLLNSERRFPDTVAEMIAAVAARQLRPYDELRAQISRIVDEGLQPTHLDTHKHTHLFPPVLDAVARLSAEFEIRWVRRPFDFPMNTSTTPWLVRATSRGLDFLRHRFHNVLNRHGCMTTDHFAGFQLTGRFGESELIEFFPTLPAGTTEFMCHPGRLGSELKAANTRLRESREWEMQALTSVRVRDTLDQHGIHLTNYRELGSGAPRAA
jgi:predicted glycoside hydrolase/deacetylase ChbG (UPF0249 family)